MSSGLRPLISEISTTGAPLLFSSARAVSLCTKLCRIMPAGRQPSSVRIDLFLGFLRELALHQQHRIAALVALVGHALDLFGNAGIDQRRHHGADHAAVAAHAGGQPVGHEARLLDRLAEPWRASPARPCRDWRARATPSSARRRRAWRSRERQGAPATFFYGPPSDFPAINQLRDTCSRTIEGAAEGFHSRDGGGGEYKPVHASVRQTNASEIASVTRGPAAVDAEHLAGRIRVERVTEEKHRRHRFIDSACAADRRVAEHRLVA